MERLLLLHNCDCYRTCVECHSHAQPETFFLCVAFWIRGVVPRANVGIQASQTPVGCLGRLEGMQNDPISSV